MILSAYQKFQLASVSIPAYGTLLIAKGHNGGPVPRQYFSPNRPLYHDGLARRLKYYSNKIPKGKCTFIAICRRSDRYLSLIFTPRTYKVLYHILLLLLLIITTLLLLLPFSHWNYFSSQRFVNSEESVKFLSRSFDMARRTEFLSRSLIFRRGD